jgi:hypothetical protein
MSEHKYTDIVGEMQVMNDDKFSLSSTSPAVYLEYKSMLLPCATGSFQEYAPKLRPVLHIPTPWKKKGAKNKGAMIINESMFHNILDFHQVSHKVIANTPRNTTPQCPSHTTNQ